MTIDWMTAASDELLRAHAMLDAALDASPSAIVIHHGDRILYCNRKYIDLWKVPDDVVLRGKVSEFFRCIAALAEDPEIVESFLDEARRQALHPDRSHLRLRNGRVLSRHVEPVSSPSGQIYGRLVAYTDITAEVWAIERYQKDRIQALEDVARLKRHLLDATTHEFRTPLSVILANAEFLEDGLAGQLPPEQLQFVQQIQGGAQRLERLLEDILDIGRIEAGELKLALRESDLGAVIAGSLERVSSWARQEGVRLMAKLPPAPLPLLLDPERVSRALLSLLANALKFTPKGGEVVVCTRRHGDKIRVEVKDTGIGVPHDEQPRLFDTFYQVESGSTRSASGAGLGLAIAKAFIEAHGGSIGVKSRPGAGSTFWFTLPLHCPNPEERGSA